MLLAIRQRVSVYSGIGKALVGRALGVAFGGACRFSRRRGAAVAVTLEWPSQHARRMRYLITGSERPALAAESGAASVSCGVSE